MAEMVKPKPEDVVSAFRNAAKELGCDKSEEQFQETLFAIGTQKIGTQKPVGQISKRGRKSKVADYVRRG